MVNKNENKILSLKNLRVSFWTNEGTVKAVRGVSFDLYRGKTLALVGESGSGKSQTSRAIMGLLASNSIIEEGEILYDGKDLLRLKEEELCLLRGSSIAMIFQDPMSSLNPIVKVGKQITEAMKVKKKRSIFLNKKRFSILYNALLKENREEKETLISLKKGRKIDESLLFSMAKKSVERNQIAIQENAHIVLKELLRIRDEFFKEGKRFSQLKRELPLLEKKVERIKDYLSERKDDFVFTFLSSLRYYLVLYFSATKKEKNLAKAALKREKLLKQGKKIKDSEVKREEAYRSEIDTSPLLIKKRAKEYLSSFILHLEKHYLKREFDVDKSAASFIKSIHSSLQISRQSIDKKALKKKAIDLLSEVGIKDPEKRVEQYPFELSGGMRQRIVISIALSSDPEILICDEPTTALDTSVQGEILDLINRLKVKRRLSVLFITHNMGVVARVADDIAILYAGKIVEKGKVDEIFYDPRHPYTWALLSSVPDLDTKGKLESIPGTPPNMIFPPAGDAFAFRNKFALQIDFMEAPPFFPVSSTHVAATWLLDPRAPKVKLPKTVKERITHYALLNKSNVARKEKNNGKKPAKSPKK